VKKVRSGDQSIRLWGLEALFAFDKDSEPRTRALLMTFAEAKKNGGIIHPALKYRIEQKVRLAGSFDGITATILDLDEKDRLIILIELMQLPVRANVKAGDVTLV
jgi:hypothetical protein